ncbi:MAG: hypothetical protein ACI4WH_07380 [Oscillospiraceae bacterium]
MKKAISLLTSMMVMSLVAANMAIPASANTGDIIYDIEDLTLTLDELRQYDTDANGNYIVPLALTVANNTQSSINAAALSIETPDMNLYPKNGTSSTYAETSSQSGSVDLLLNPVDNASGSTLVYTSDGSNVSTVADMYFLVPANATSGSQYDVNFNTDVAYVSNADDFSIIDSNKVKFNSGFIKITAGAEIAIGDVTVGCDGDSLASDTIVEVPVVISGNPGLGSFTARHDVGEGAELVADSDGVGFVVTPGLCGTSELMTSITPDGCFICYDNAKASETTEDGTLYSIQVKVPAGTAKGTVIPVTFVDCDDNFFSHGGTDTSEFVPTLASGSITVGDAEPTTTSATEPVQTEGKIAIDNVEYSVTNGDTLTEDVIVEVPVNITGNPGLGSFVARHDVENGAELVADSEGVGFTVTPGICTTSELMSSITPDGCFICYDNAKASQTEEDGTLYSIQVKIPAGSKVGDEFPVTFVDCEDNFFSHGGADSSEFVPELINGSVKLVGEVVTEGEIAIEDKVVDIEEDVLSEDMIVNVKVNITGNPGLGSFVARHDVENGAELVADSEGVGFVVDPGLCDTSELMTSITPDGCFICYDNAKASQTEEDGTLYEIQVKIPAGSKVGDVFPVVFVDCDDNFFSHGGENSDEFVPKLINGSITLNKAIVTTTTTPEPTTTTPEPTTTTPEPTTTTPEPTTTTPTPTTTTAPPTVTTPTPSKAGTIAIDELKVEVEGGTLAEDIIVEVPVKISQNPGLGSFVARHDVENGASLVADSDGVGFVVTPGLCDTSELMTSITPDGCFICYDNAKASQTEEDGTLYSIQVKIPAGSKVGDVFPVVFVDCEDNFFSHGGENSDAFVPSLVNGSVELVAPTTTTTTTPEPTTTTPEPTTTTPEPTTTTPEPTTTTPEPTTTTPEPTTTTPEPTTTTPEPTTTTPEPTTTTPTPTTTTPTPTTQPTQPPVTGSDNPGSVSSGNNNTNDSQGGAGGEGQGGAGGQGGSGSSDAQGGSAQGGNADGQGGSISDITIGNSANGQGGDGGQGGNATGQGGNATGQGGNATGQGGNATGQGGNATGQGGNGTGGNVSGITIGNSGGNVNPIFNINVSGGGTSGGTGSVVTNTPTVTTQATSATTKATSATTKATSATTTAAKDANSPKTGSTGIGATLMAMVAAAASAIALKKKND